MNIEGKQQSLLTFRVGPVICCAPSLPVRSIITPPKLTHPPGSDTSQPGIFKHGSHIVKVLDLRQKFGVDSSEQTHPGNLIITIFEKESFAFWVDQILDVFDFPSTGWGNLPAAIPRGVFSRTLLLNKKIHLYSEFEKLATINDLGYLEHYIQQLKQQVVKNTGTEKTISPSTSQPIHQKKENPTPETRALNETVKPVSQIKTDKEITATQQTSINTIHPNTAATQSLAGTSTTKKSETDNTFTTKTNRIQKPIANKRVNTTTITAKPRPVDRQQVTAKKEFTPLTQLTNKTEDKPVSSQRIPSIEPPTEESESYFGIIFFFIFLLAVLGAGLYYLLSENNTKKNYKYRKEQTVNTVEFNSNSSETYESETFTPPEQTVSLQEKSDTVSNSGIKNDTTGNFPDIENKAVLNSDYQADIIQRNDEITITIHEPASNNQLQQKDEPITAESVIKREIKETEIKQETKINPTPLNTLKENELSNATKPEKLINEVIHIVVKGDTLWAIAKKYVHNPFLYPELARLSKIKNPHRIYPGNRVRIRFIKN